MKTKLTFLSLFILFFSFTGLDKAKACINPDTVVNIIVNYDSANAPLINEVALRFTNIRMMNEMPNKICSCALTQYSGLFTNIEYVAFVDSGTNNPYQNFAAFNTLLASSTAWNNATNGHNNWSGYIANVINSGLSANDPVELIVRASAPVGTFYTLTGDTSLMAFSLQDDLAKEVLGTDAWNDATQTLDQSHTGIRSFNPAKGSNLTFQQKPLSYFTDLDDDILNNIPDGIKVNGLDNSTVVYPNPFENNIKIQWQAGNETQVELRLYNSFGQLVFKETHSVNPKQKQIFELQIADQLAKGQYTLEMINDNNRQFVKLIH